MANTIPGSLADKWESDGVIRARVRSLGQLCKWPKPALVGIPSGVSTSLNAETLYHMAKWWSAAVELPQAIPVALLRAEAT